ncbi:MAG: hypothetical protein ACLSVD_01770 [Eggerthellaceae bacterium]
MYADYLRGGRPRSPTCATNCSPARPQARDPALSLSRSPGHAGRVRAPNQRGHPQQASSTTSDLGRQPKTMGLLVITDAMLNRVGQLARGQAHAHLLESSTCSRTSTPRVLQQRVALLPKRNHPAITQNVEYLLDSVLASRCSNPSSSSCSTRRADCGKRANSSTSAEQMGYITNAEAGCGLPALRRAHRAVRQPLPEGHRLYRLMTTKPGGDEAEGGRPLSDIKGASSLERKTPTAGASGCCGAAAAARRRNGEGGKPAHTRTKGRWY